MMVYCQSCGTKNEEENEYCSKCGTSLKETAEKRPERRQRQREECFGLPYGNLVIGIIIGIILIVAGLSSIYKFQIPWQYVGSALIVLIGLLIIIGAIYRTRRK
jgi:uncharacterized membrane protein YvbJ